MNRDSVDWWGPMPAVVTPFRQDGAIDEPKFCENIEIIMGKGATGVVVAGCTGEFWALSAAEKRRLYALGREAVAGRGTLIVGAGAVTIDETNALVAAAAEEKADGALVLPPYFVKLTDEELLGHFRAVSDAAALPIVVYNIPGNAVNAVTPELADRLADFDAIVAIKESSGDWSNYIDTFYRVGDRIRVFCGPSSQFGVPAVFAGADGTIDCFPNLWAPGGLDLFHAARAGRIDEANRLQELGRDLTRLFTTGGRTLYPATKAAMTMMGLPGGVPRSPLRPLEGAPLAGLREGLVALGLMTAADEARQPAAAE